MSKTYLYSLAYAKYGDAVFYSHLDTIRVLERALRRTGIAVFFTQGWNPHIRLSTVSALPLGVATDGEWFSMRLLEDLDPGYILRLLNAQLPLGFYIVDARRGEPPEQEEKPPAMAIRFTGSAASARAAAERLMARDKIEITGERKGRSFSRDMRPFLESYELLEEDLVFRFRSWDGRAPKIGDMAKTLSSVVADSGLAVESIKVVGPDPKKNDEDAGKNDEDAGDN